MFSFILEVLLFQEAPKAWMCGFAEKILGVFHSLSRSLYVIFWFNVGGPLLAFLRVETSIFISVLETKMQTQIG